jgi:hypothetical protein
MCYKDLKDISTGKKAGLGRIGVLELAKRAIARKIREARS